MTTTATTVVKWSQQLFLDVTSIMHETDISIRKAMHCGNSFEETATVAHNWSTNEDVIIASEWCSTGVTPDVELGITGCAAIQKGLAGEKVGKPISYYNVIVSAFLANVFPEVIFTVSWGVRKIAAISKVHLIMRFRRQLLFYPLCCSKGLNRPVCRMDNPSLTDLFGRTIWAKLIAPSFLLPHF